MKQLIQIVKQFPRVWRFFTIVEIFHVCGDFPQVWRLTLITAITKVSFLRERLGTRFYPHSTL